MGKPAVWAIGALAIGGAIAVLAGTANASEKPAPKPAPPKPGPKPAPPKPAPASSSPPAPPPPVGKNAPPVTTTTTFPAETIPRPKGADPAITPPAVIVPDVVIKPDDVNHMARELALNLASLQLATGGPRSAQGKENQTLVRTFQKGAGLKTIDGLAGPATFIALARHLDVGTLPLVMYWPKKADRKTVLAYRTAIRAVAGSAPKLVGEALRAAANRERGQGAANGPLVPEGVDVAP